MASVSEDTKRVKDQKERVEKIDFKMVTFSLGGKDYGIDIMKVREISKAEKFTYVPNAAPFVRGVHNLRGEIISIIDLRIMFHLATEKRKEGALDNIIILRLNEYMIGVVVDTIDKVIGISAESIQPSPPIFSDINLKYIMGVVNHDGRLYILLDVDRILGQQQEETQSEPERFEPVKREAQPLKKEETAGAEIDYTFIIDTLATFRRFTVNEINEAWVRKRFEEWKTERAYRGEGFQLKDPEEADEYLSSFFSPYSGQFWGEDYIDGIEALLPESVEGGFSVWDAGCGKGYESFSLAALLRNRYHECRIKIWAHDSDLLSISTAPNLVFGKDEVPERFKHFLVEGKNGFQFNQGIRDSVLFEYHDLLNLSAVPDVDMIVARDILSFLKPGDQQRLIREFADRLRPGGILFLGTNERISGELWTEVTGSSGVVAFRREKG